MIDDDRPGATVTPYEDGPLLIRFAPIAPSVLPDLG
jgi:hypothetical protein